MGQIAKQNPQLVIIGCVLLLALFFFSPKSPVESSFLPLSVPLLEQEQARNGLPAHLVIPRIGANASIEFVGLTPKGFMDVPKHPMNTAWFELGPRPGEEGSAVIAGHYGWKDGTQAVFDDLYTLQKGDKIYVEDETGTTTVFVVRELRSYGEYEDASDVFGSNDGKAHLNLVTCEGDWNKLSQSYSKRLVVFTDKEEN